MATLQAIMYQLGVNAIDRARRDAIRAFTAERERWEADWQEHKRQVEAGTIPDVEGDEESGYVFDFGEHVGEMQYQVDECLKLMREALMLTIYHYWEKEACALLAIDSYGQTNVFNKARADPRFEVDEVGLDKARRIANCIKHDVELGKFDKTGLYQDYPELFDMEHQDPKSKQGWQSALRLTDQHLDDAIKAVRTSGPKSRPEPTPPRGRAGHSA